MGNYGWQNQKSAGLLSRRMSGMDGIILGAVAALYLIGAAGSGTFSTRALLASRSFRGYNLRGNQRYEQHDYAGAMEDYTRMIELRPDASDGYTMRAMAYYRSGLYTQAIADETKALTPVRDRYSLSALHFNRALSYQARRSWDASIADYQEAIRQNPGNSDAPRAMGSCYTSRAEDAERKHNYAQAVADEKQAATFSPENPLAWGNLGWYEYEAGRISDSITHSRRCLQMNGQATYAMLNLALCHAVTGDPSARREYADAIEQANRRDVQGAIQDVQNALGKQPDSRLLREALTKLQHATPTR